MTLSFIKPMLATNSKPFNSDEHQFEVKWDGFRCLTYIYPHETILYSRNGNIITSNYPELKNINQGASKFPMVIDGELVVMRAGKPSFPSLQVRHYLKKQDKILRASVESPALIMAFDLLHMGEDNLMGKPLDYRYSLLKKAAPKHEGLQISEAVSATGLDFYQAAKEMGLEGIMAKKKNSTYLPGKRSDHWLKFKVWQEEDLVICGYTLGSLSQGFGGLVLGVYRGDKLYYRGLIGTGFSHDEITKLLNLLRPLKRDSYPFVTSPPYKLPLVTWVEPKHVCKITYLEVTNKGELRHGSYQGLKTDKKPQDCQLEDYL